MTATAPHSDSPAGSEQDPAEAPSPARRVRRWRRRGRRGPAEEDLYRTRRYRGATFFTSRVGHQDLTVVLKRFPVREGVDDVTAPVFVLVHGLGVSSRYFQPLAAELAAVGRVYLVDLPGYGAAPDPRRDVGLGDHADALGAVIAHIADRWPAAGPPIVVGHSMGSNVVALLAQRQPDVAERIVLMAPTLEPVRRRFRSALGRLLADAPRETPTVFFIALTDYLIRCGLRYMLAQTPHLLADEPELRMPDLRARVLVICGDRDVIVSVAWGQKFAEGLRDGEYRTVKGPHVVMHTDPRQIAKHIAEWAR
ncbi:alpha/beta fold hydrolase [Schumannella sp. 10F1B-5-1]|uniref:alpha/beta fold hydrolase n=1 Tax=Schumannella sp. 10F1B-5-1 TaxID=2590780 RepID=UPI0011320A6F|nr:alpha/beta fold hydrolase [Schumannella sp. 10F1B-5-1]TPW70186.1 lysophospholipase [Schumannella sp. 10F1B-5-1]